MAFFIKRIPIVFVGLVLALVALTVTARADTIELSAGVQVDGKIVRTNDGGPKPSVVVEVDPGLRIAIPQSRIRKTISDADLSWYKSQLDSVGEDAEAHYQLARECKKNGLSAQCDFHFRRAIEIDPNHSRSRAALDYGRKGNKWVLFDELQRQRGMISDGGTWKVSEVYAREKMIDQFNEGSKLWIKELNALRTAYFRQNKRSADALASIQAIDDPLASQALAEALEKSRGNDSDPPSLRRIYVKRLGALKTSTAVQALVKTGLVEPDIGIRTEALMQLQEYGGRSAVATYLPIVSSPKSSPASVTAALAALNYFPDPELWDEYVNALVTAHESVSAAGPGIQAGRSSTGGMGLGMGSKQETRTDYQNNPGALSLLNQIAPDVNYRYDQAAWRNHFANLLMRSPSDLRRDP
jgi:hypothetical protein